MAETPTPAQPRATNPSASHTAPGPLNPAGARLANPAASHTEQMAFAQAPRAVYRVVHKHHDRATLQEQPAVDNRGNPYVITNMGPSRRYEVGELIDDLLPSELEAFPDRFELVSKERLELEQSGRTPHLNPELFKMLARDHAGEATSDEHILVALFVPYLAHHAAGQVTSAETAALEEALQEFKLALFV